MRFKILHSLLLLLALSACSIYKVDIQQGNILEPESITQLKLGMSQRQVAFLLGSPLLKDPFHKNRWDYVYTIRLAGGETKGQNLALFFKGDKLVKIDDSGIEMRLLKP